MIANTFPYCRINENPTQKDFRLLLLLATDKDKLNTLSEYVSQNANSNGLGSYLEWLVKKKSVSGYKFQGEWFDVSDEEAYSNAVFSF